MSSEHNFLDEIFLKDLMFDDFKAKSWSDEKDKIDEEKAKESTAMEDENNALESAKDFANCWIEAYYHDFGFDNGLLTFDIEKWGDDGPDTIYYEVDIKRDGKPYQTLIVEIIGKGVKK